MRTLMVFVAILLFAGAAVACGDDGEGGGSTSTPVETVIATSPVTGGSDGPTGIAPIDRTIEIVAQNDAAAFNALLRTRREACTEATGAGGPPKCFNAPGMPDDGTRVEAFPYYTCELEWQFDAQAFAERILPRLGELYAATQINESALPDLYPGGAYALIFTDAAGGETAHALVVTLVGIVAVDSRCGGSAPDYLADAPPFNAPRILYRGPAFEQ